VITASKVTQEMLLFTFLMKTYNIVYEELRLTFLLKKSLRNGQPNKKGHFINFKSNSKQLK